jgi:hypothetical protein
MRRKRLLALVVSSVALGLGAGPAMAQGSASGQFAEQVAGSQQSASSSANSTQVAPTNQNISVRVLSPGDGGSVDQSNSSAAASFAGNANSTSQAVEQLQAGGGAAVQEAAQLAANQQSAASQAESKQIAPKNQNISVRVLSPGDDGDVTQSNESAAKSGAFNGNELEQSVEQAQAGGECCEAKKPEHTPKKDDYGHEKDDYGREKDDYGHKKDDYGHKKDDYAPKKDHCCGGVGIQAAAQEAYNKQNAESSAKSLQVKPENSNLSVRVLSPGDDGDVTQSNESAALSVAKNANSTNQAIEQLQAGSGCGCYGGVAIQAAGQKALNWQNAESDAESKQIYPTNKSLSFRFKSWGDGGDLTQSNASFAGSFAGNYNALDQLVGQAQGSGRR